MASKHREEKTIAAVACPTCGAPRGAACWDGQRRPRLEYGRPILCPDRRLAWQMIRDGEIRDHEEH